MAGHLFILTGPSACGKTTLLNRVCSTRSLCGRPSIAAQLRAVKAPKYSTRVSRGPDDDCAHVDVIELPDFDIAYAINDNVYGLRKREIEAHLERGQNVFIVLSDFRVIKRVKDTFGRSVKCVFVSSAIDPVELDRTQLKRHRFAPGDEAQRSLSRQFARLQSASRLNLWTTVAHCVADLDEVWRKYRPEALSTAMREERMRAFHTRYVDHIHLFDHVILNYTNGRPGEMTRQMANIVKGYAAREERPERNYPPVFVVAAASAAGKGTLMEMLRLIGGDRVQLMTKWAGRLPKPNDKRDGMIALNGDPFPPEADFQWVFHKPDESMLATGEDSFKGVEYAVSSEEIYARIDSGIPQIVISNFQQFPEWIDRFGKHVVCLYLHRLSSREQIAKYQRDNCDTETEARVRIAEIGKVHADYIAQIASVDHVLLNTRFPEDLYDQMFQLLEIYHARRTGEPAWQTSRAVSS